MSGDNKPNGKFLLNKNFPCVRVCVCARARVCMSGNALVVKLSGNIATENKNTKPLTSVVIF